MVVCCLCGCALWLRAVRVSLRLWLWLCVEDMSLWLCVCDRVFVVAFVVVCCGCTL